MASIDSMISRILACISVFAVSFAVAAAQSGSGVTLPPRAAATPDLRLVEALQRQDGELARMLLKRGVDVNATQPDGATALAWAAHWNDLETADLVIKAGANLNAANDLGVTPLMLAAGNGSAPMI